MRARIWSHWLEDGDTNRTKTFVLTGNTTWTGVYKILGDINNDGIVNILDVVIAATAFGSIEVDDPTTPWDETINWNPIADLNQNGKVTITDIVIIALAYRSQHT